MVVKLNQPDAVESPQWWTKRLYKRLTERQDEIEVLDNYYSGNHPIPWMPEAMQDEFKHVLKITRSNYMGLVADAQVERMVVEGFRIGDSQVADAETWDLWQRNNMDADFDQCLLEATIAGRGYTLIAPPGDEDDFARMYVEHPSQCIVAYQPGNRRKRAAGLKAWVDDWTGDVFVTLWLPDKIYRFSATQKQLNALQSVGTEGLVSGAYEWKPRSGNGYEAVEDNTLEEVPLFEQPNNPRMLTGGVSELIDLIPIQDRINKTLADRLITQDFGAFPQKWATGYPSEDEAGNPTPGARVGRDRLLATDVAETKFGQFQGTSLDPYSNAKREDVKDIASRSRTPAQYLLGELSNVNGETLRASESGLVSKVRQRMRGHSDPLESAVRLLRKAAGLKDVKGQEAMEVLWRNPEFRSEGELVDALVKLAQIHVPDKALWEQYGATPQMIARWEEMQTQQAARQDVLAMMADRFRAEQGGVAAGADQPASGSGTRQDRGSSNGGSSPLNRPRRDQDGDGVVDERSNRVR